MRGLTRLLVSRNSNGGSTNLEEVGRLGWSCREKFHLIFLRRMQVRTFHVGCSDLPPLLSPKRLANFEKVCAFLALVGRIVISKAHCSPNSIFDLLLVPFIIFAAHLFVT